MIIPAYIRRTAEIELALLVDYAYIHHKSIQSIIDLFNSLADIVNFREHELLKTAIINYKKLMPTAEELSLVSDLAQSRAAFIRASIIKNKLSRKTIYETRRKAGDITIKLSPKTKMIITDALIDFLNKAEPLIQAFSEISLNCYNFED